MGELVVREEPRKLLIERADDEIEISLAVFSRLDPPFAQVHTGDGMTWLTLYGASETVSYELVEWEPYHGFFRARRIMRTGAGASRCDLCWTRFETEGELAQHKANEGQCRFEVG